VRARAKRVDARSLPRTPIALVSFQRLTSPSPALSQSLHQLLALRQCAHSQLQPELPAVRTHARGSCSATHNTRPVSSKRAPRPCSLDYRLPSSKHCTVGSRQALGLRTTTQHSFEPETHLPQGRPLFAPPPTQHEAPFSEMHHLEQRDTAHPQQDIHRRVMHKRQRAAATTEATTTAAVRTTTTRRRGACPSTARPRRMR